MIRTVVEGKRGCGYRKEGGLYLMGGKLAHVCGLLPIPLDVCPCCMQGIKPSRGFTWISPKLWEGRECSFSSKLELDKQTCRACPPFFDPTIKKVGLMWVGEKFYPTPDKFLDEGMKMGVSKRIAQIPKDLVVGETFVLLAHRIPEPHIFASFVPLEIQYVVKQDDTPEYIESLEKRGITPVRVINREPDELPLED